MLIPYRDINPVSRRPYVTWMLILVNILLFFSYATPMAGANLPVDVKFEQAWDTWSVFPYPNTSPISLVTHMFLHGGWLHLLGNMLMLYIFGNNLEDIFGAFRFLIFYLVCGLAGGIFFALTEPDPLVPAGGASGAIAGIMGGYLLLFPRAKIVSLLLLPNILWPFSIIIRIFWKAKIWGYFPILFLTFGIPAWIYLGIWALLNFLGAYSGFESNIAYTIHLAGFAAGLLLTAVARMGGTLKLPVTSNLKQDQLNVSGNDFLVTAQKTGEDPPLHARQQTTSGKTIASPWTTPDKNDNSASNR